MIARTLNPEEWNTVEGGQLPEVLKYVNPRELEVVVVEKDGKVAASVLYMRVPHLEALWIAPEHRGNSGVFRALIKKAFSIPRESGDLFVLADAPEGDSRMRSICERLSGKELDHRFYVLPVPRGT